MTANCGCEQVARWAFTEATDLDESDCQFAKVKALTRKHLITNSRAKCSRLCARKHELRFLRGWRSVDDADALVFGTVFHQALEAWWRNRGPTALDAALSVDAAKAQLAKLEAL